MQLFDGCRRVYFDAAFGRAVELQFGLPQATQFDDVKIVDRLLGDDIFDELSSRCCPSSPAAALQRARVIWSAFAAGNLLRRVIDSQMDMLYYDIELPAVDAAIHMIRTGMPVDLPLLQGLKASRTVQLEIARCQLVDAAGRDLNPDSAEDVATFLFDEVGLPVLSQSRNGAPSTNDTVLSQLESRHPAVCPLRS